MSNALMSSYFLAEILEDIIYNSNTNENERNLAINNLIFLENIMKAELEK